MLLPKKGKKLPAPFDGNLSNLDYGATVAAALRQELGNSHQAIKKIMAWSNASERTVKYWLTGASGPSGLHLAALARHSDAIFDIFLTLSCRGKSIDYPKLSNLRASLRKLLADLDEIPAETASFWRPGTSDNGVNGGSLES